MLQLDSENADRDLTSLVTVLTHTPDASNPRLCVAYVAFGDGSKNLDGSGGDFELTIQVGSQVIQPSPQVVTFGAVTRAGAFTFQFPVPANTAVVIKALSPNAADTDVDVTAYLYDAHSITPARAGYLDNINNVALQTTQAQTGDAYAVVNSGTHGNAALKTLIDTVDTVVDAILSDTGTDGVVISSSQMNSIAAALLDLANGIESGITLRQAQRLQLAAAVGKLSGAATSTVSIRNPADSKDRVVATVDSDGNRTAVTLDAT